MRRPASLQNAKPTLMSRERINELLRTIVPLLLRASLGVTFLWFGALKLTGEPTLTASLISAIAPFLDPDVSVPVVGGIEVVIGAGLLIGRGMPLFIGAAVLHLLGTFLVLLVRPDVAFVDGNPLLPSVEGEYVIKNLVLLAATASLALHSLPPRPVAPQTLRLSEVRKPAQREPTEGAA